MSNTMDFLNNNVISCDKVFDIFSIVLRPMMLVGHEGELIGWLKEIGLLRGGVQCNKTPGCSGIWMHWNRARSVDKYVWTCSQCLSKTSIRDGSFFFNMKCDLKTVIQAMMGWCKEIPIEVLCETIVGVVLLKKNVIKRVYDRCSETASCYMIQHSLKWKLGGPGRIVLIDVFPGGYITPPTSPEVKQPVPHRKRVRQHILCIADLVCIPPRTWLQIVKNDYQAHSNKGSGNSHPGLVEDALKLVRRHVLPGSMLVANERARCCSVEALRELQGYDSVISVERLIELNQPGSRRLEENLETIWQSVAEVCEYAQDQNDRDATIALHEYMWRHSFAQSAPAAFQNMYHHIADQYSFED